MDAAGMDAASMDSGLIDLGPPDSELADSDVADSDLIDMSAPDSEIDDLGFPDAEIPDADVADAELPDADLPDMAAPTPTAQLTEVRCSAERGSLGLTLEGTLAGEPVARFTLGLLGAEGAPLPFDGGALAVDLDPYGPHTDFSTDGELFTLTASRAVAAPVEQLAAITIRVEDAAGQLAEAEAPCQPPAPLAPGAEGCDPLGAFTRCAEGERCAPDDRCQPAEAPQLIEAAAALDLDAPALAVRVLATDADGDLAAARVTLRRADGGALLGGALRVPLLSLETPDGLAGQGGGLLPDLGALWADAVAADLTVVDETGLESASARVVVGRPAPLQVGDRCDPLEAFSRCPDGAACASADGAPLSPAACVPTPTACPEGWAVGAPLMDGPGAWRLDGLIEAEGLLTAPGSCAAGPGQAVARFEPPAAGRYRARLSGGGRLIARTACALPAPRFEVGCGAEIVMSAHAGQPVFFIIAGPPGAFSLEITEEAQP